jgi:hypothetical protein
VTVLIVCLAAFCITSFPGWLISIDLATRWNDTIGWLFAVMLTIGLAVMYL